MFTSSQISCFYVCACTCGRVHHACMWNQWDVYLGALVSVSVQFQCVTYPFWFSFLCWVCKLLPWLENQNYIKKCCSFPCAFGPISTHLPIVANFILFSCIFPIFPIEKLISSAVICFHTFLWTMLTSACSIFLFDTPWFLLLIWWFTPIWLYFTLETIFFSFFLLYSYLFISSF